MHKIFCECIELIFNFSLLKRNLPEPAEDRYLRQDSEPRDVAQTWRRRDQPTTRTKVRIRVL